MPGALNFFCRDVGHGALKLESDELIFCKSKG